MKQSQRLTNGFIACGIALAMVSSLAAQTAVEGAAKVVRIKGSARYSVGGGQWQNLKVGSVLKAGTIIQTDTQEGSYVDLMLGDGAMPMAGGPPPAGAAYQPYVPSSLSSSTSYKPSAEQNMVRVWQNTALGIDKLTTMQTGADNVTETFLDLKAGRITGNVKKMSAASKYEVKLPNGVAGIRGTIFDITADGVVRVLIGSVVMAWVDNSTGNVVTQVVMGGQQYDAKTAQMSPLPPADVKVIDKIIVGMRPAGMGAAAPTTYVPDKTINFGSPIVEGP